MQLRPYQAEAIDAVDRYLSTRGDNPAVVLPTGAGKSVVMAAMIHRYLGGWPGTRICILAHVKELVEQNARKLAALWDLAPIGIYSAGLGRRDTETDVIFASIQSVHRRAADLGPFDLVFIDEAHRIPISGEGMYRGFLEGARELNPDLRVVGFTATPYRLGPGRVVGPEYTLNGVAYDVSVRVLIEQGFLSRLTSKGGHARADLTGVHVRNGEFVAGELEAAVTAGDLVERAVGEALRLSEGRRARLWFCAGVEHAERVAAVLGSHGIETPVVHAGTPAAERDRVIAAFRDGALSDLANVNVLSEGFDAPHVDCIVMLRPTKSAGLYYQQVGRGLRLAPGKADCLVLDFAGNIATHGPIDAIQVRDRKPGAKREDDEPLAKTCPECQEMVGIAVMVCPACGHAWPKPPPKHDDRPTEAPILAEPPETIPVDDVFYSRHAREGKTPSLRVDYQCGIRQFSEWVCLEHTGWPRLKAEAWWSWRTGERYVPETVEAALEWIEIYGLRCPSAITVKQSGRFPDIVSYEWRSNETDARTEGFDARDAARRAGGGGEPA